MGSWSVSPAGSLMQPATPFSPVAADVRLARVSKPWRKVARIVFLVVLAYFVTQTLGGAPGMVLMGDYITMLVCGIIAVPAALCMLFMMRPKLVHLERAIPDPSGGTTHPLGWRGTLVTPVPTQFSRHLIVDDEDLDMPRSLHAWLVFIACCIAALGISFVLFLATLGGEEVMALMTLLMLPLLIPLILVAFSIPVIGWWAHSTPRIGIETSQRKAEIWLMAGVLSGIPALWVNDGLASLVNAPEWLIVSAFAPIGEELFKAGAVWLCARWILSPRHGFQVGFTVGLGFAIVENLQYIVMASLGAAVGDPLSFALTTLVRGIGSIPGHALWTAMSGVAIGWHLHRDRATRAESAATMGLPSMSLAVEAPPKEADFVRIDGRTGQLMPEFGADQAAAEQFAAIEAQGGWHLPLPTNVWVGITLAIFGHAFWNGSSTLLYAMADALNLNIWAVLILDLTWITVLVTAVLIIAAGALRGVRKQPLPLKSQTTA